MGRKVAWQEGLESADHGNSYHFDFTSSTKHLRNCTMFVTTANQFLDDVWLSIDMFASIVLLRRPVSPYGPF